MGHGAAFWKKVGEHCDSYSSLMAARRGSVSVDRPVFGLDGSSGALLMPDQDDPLLALGVSGAGKTASVIAVNALLSPGPMFCATSRSDVYMATALARARIGRVWHFSARGSSMPGATPLCFSPLQGCESFEYAQQVAKRFADYRDMGTTAREDHGSHPFFRERSGQLLAVLFFYAAQRDYDMGWVLGKVATGNGQALVETAAELKVKDQRPLVSAILEGIITSAPQELSGVMSTATRALNCYSTEAALRTQRDPNFDFRDFVRGRPFESSGLLRPQSQWTRFDADYEAIGMGRHEMGVFDSIYVTDSDSEAPILPIYLELIHRIREAAAEYAEECRMEGKPTPIGTALILDELRASPVPQIERILSDCRDRGLIVVGGLQNLNQALDLYQDAGKAFLSAWRCTMAFRGILDKETLELLSFLSGTYMKEKQGWSESRNAKTQRWEWTNNVSQDEHARLTPEQIRMGHPTFPDAALMVSRDKHHSWVRAVPYFCSEPWPRVLINSAEHARRDGLTDLPLPPLAKNGNYTHLEALGLADRFRDLQKGALRCLRTLARSAVAVPTPTSTLRPSGTGTTARKDRHAQTRTTSMRAGAGARAVRSSTTWHRGLCSSG